MCAMIYTYFTMDTDQPGSVDILFKNQIILLNIQGTER